MKRHVDVVEQCLRELGEESSAVKDSVASVTGNAQAWMMGGARDDLVKSAPNDSAIEHTEVASDTALIQAREAPGQRSIVDTCPEILRDE
jgi:ferritin-like metal-binding protein YciE